MKRTFQKNYKGLIGTIFFHGALLVVLILFGFHTPLPLPAEEGILVNFGYDEVGSGNVDPAPAATESVPEQTPESNPELPDPTPVDPVESVDEVVTQDIEEAASLEEKKKEEKEDNPKEKTPEELEQERLEKERIEQERLKEIERKKQEEEEKRRLEEEERKRKEIKDRFRQSLGQGQNPQDTNSAGEGEGEGAGNQGVETGDPNSNNYGDGKGLGDEGISFSLEGRGKVALPKPKLEKNEEGIVVIEIRVNANGDVISAAPTKGSTTTSPYLRELAEKAALKARFTAKPNAPDQFGTITYRFLLE